MVTDEKPAEKNQKNMASNRAEKASKKVKKAEALVKINKLAENREILKVHEQPSKATGERKSTRVRYQVQQTGVPDASKR